MRPVPPIALAALLLLAGCGDDDEGAATTTVAEAATTTTAAEATTTTTEAPTTTTAAATSTTEDLSGEGIGDVEAVLGDLLIRPGELDDQTLVDTGYTPPEGSGPCGLDVDSQLPPSSLVGAVFESSEHQLRVMEELRAYPTVDDAVAAQAALKGAPPCAGAEDVAVDVGADEAFLVATPESGNTLIVARVADVVAVFDITGETDQRQIAAFGVGKVLAFIEAG